MGLRPPVVGGPSTAHAIASRNSCSHFGNGPPKAGPRGHHWPRPVVIMAGPIPYSRLALRCCHDGRGLVVFAGRTGECKPIEGDYELDFDDHGWCHARDMR